MSVAHMRRVCSQSGEDLSKIFDASLFFRAGARSWRTGGDVKNERSHVKFDGASLRFLVSSCQWVYASDMSEDGRSPDKIISAALLFRASTCRSCLCVRCARETGEAISNFFWLFSIYSCQCLSVSPMRQICRKMGEGLSKKSPIAVASCQRLSVFRIRQMCRETYKAMSKILACRRFFVSALVGGAQASRTSKNG